MTFVCWRRESQQGYLKATWKSTPSRWLSWRGSPSPLRIQFEKNWRLTRPRRVPMRRNLMRWITGQKAAIDTELRKTFGRYGVGTMQNLLAREGRFRHGGNL